MARKIDRLNARLVASLAKPGRHPDGGNLYLVVDRSGAKQWAFIFRWGGKQREMGLGSVSSVSLARAREMAAENRAILADGKDPIEVRRAAAAPDEKPTFGDFADEYVKAKSPEWRNAKHRAQWKMTLTEYARPIRSKRVDEITTEDVLAVLKPIWLTKPETATRLRGRVESVLDAARASNLRSGENPARWRGHLDKLLPKRQKLSRGHHAAMSYADVPAFMVRLRKNGSVSTLGLEFTILTAARSGEVLGARWREIDMAAKVWTVPANRMKAGHEHRVPLCARAVEILAKAHAIRTSDYVFPGQKRDRPLSVMAFDMALRRLGAGDVTTHGFRSSFRDWAGNETHFPRDLAEAALSHAVGDETERAYRRSDALEKRRRLMDAWAEYCDGLQVQNVVPLRAAGAV